MIPYLNLLLPLLYTQSLSYSSGLQKFVRLIGISVNFEKDKSFKNDFYYSIDSINFVETLIIFCKHVHMDTWILQYL